MSDKKVVEAMNSSYHGYIVEWRLRPESAAVADLMEINNGLGKKWSRANYKPDLFEVPTLPSGRSLIRPRINSDFLRRHDVALGVLSKIEALAVMYCLMTMLDLDHPRLYTHVEWRIQSVTVKRSHEVTIDSEPDAETKRMSEVSERLDRAVRRGLSEPPPIAHD